jgi:hypothetical protein
MWQSIPRWDVSPASRESCSGLRRPAGRFRRCGSPEGAGRSGGARSSDCTAHESCILNGLEIYYEVHVRARPMLKTK